MTDNSRSEKKSRCNYADCLRKRGMFDKALEELETADELNKHSGDLYWKARILDGRGRTLLEKNLTEAAVETLQASLEISEEKAFEALKRRTLNGLAMSSLLNRDYSGAENYCLATLETADDSKNDSQTLEANVILADVMLNSGKYYKAFDHARNAVRIAESSDKPLLKSAAAAAEGRVFQRTGNIEKGTELLKKAAAIADTHGYGNLFWFRGTEEFRRYSD